MSALFFPTVGLTTGTQYTGNNGVTYVYDGVKWVGHGQNLSPGTSSLVNNGHVVQVDPNGNLVIPGYVIPATTGTTNQVLTWPTNGNVLTWTTPATTAVWQLTSGTAVLSLGADGVLNFPNNNIDAGTSSIAISSYVYSELAWHNNNIIGDLYENLDTYVGADSMGAYIVNESTNSGGTGTNINVWYFDPNGVLHIGKSGLGPYDLVQNVSADIVDGNGNSLVYVASTATAPDARLNGQLWFNSVEGRAYIKYEDIWVDLSPTIIPQPSTYLDELSISGTTISQTNTTGTEAVIINNNTSSWQFGTDGKLTFPAGYALPNTVGTAGQVLSVSTNSNVLYWTTASGGALSSVLGVVTFPGDLLIGTLWPNDIDKESVVWAKDDTEYLGLWWGGDQTYPTTSYGPVAGIQIGTGATDDFTITPSPTGTNITLAINGDMDTLEWVFDRDGILTLPFGSTINDTPNAPGTGNGQAVEIKPGGASQSNQLLRIYPTVPSPDANHLHLTSGDLTITDLFLGDDHQFVQIATNGKVCIGTYGTAGHFWQFGTDGSVTFPNGPKISIPSGTPRTGAIAITSSTELLIGTNTTTTNNLWTFGIDGSTILPENTLKGYCFTATNSVFNYIPQRAQFMYTDSPILGLISTIGGVWYIKGPGLVGWKPVTAVQDNGGVALLVDIAVAGDGSEFHSGGHLPTSPDLVYTISQYLEFDLKASDKTWTFSENGSLTFPDATVQTTAWNTSTAVYPSQIVSGSTSTSYFLSAAGTYVTPPERITYDPPTDNPNNISCVFAPLNGDNAVSTTTTIARTFTTATFHYNINLNAAGEWLSISKWAIGVSGITDDGY